MLQIKHSSGANFDLFPDTKLSIEETSVFFGKDGAFSLPLDLPNTDNNLSLLGFPYRIDRKSKFITDLNVQISAGTWLRSARMEVQSARRDDKITVELYFAESKFYREIDGKKLPDIFKGVIEEGVGSSVDDKAFYLWTKLDKVMAGSITDNYYVFPVLAQKFDKQFEKTEKGVTEKCVWKDFIILNRQAVPRKDGSEGANTINASGTPYYNLAKMRFDNTPAFEKSSLNYPVGYGATPFIKFTYLIHKLFEYFGYTLYQSIFDTEESFIKKCYINNTADAIVNGYIDYSQIVPDVSISDYLESVENSYGCEFIFDDVHKTVTPFFWKDVIKSSPSHSLAGKMEDYPLVSQSRSKSLRLIFDRSLTENTPFSFDTYSELFQKYGHVKQVFPDYQSLSSVYAQSSLSEGLYLTNNDGLIYRVYFSPRPSGDTVVYDSHLSVVEKDTLFYGGSSYENEERNMKFFMPAMLEVPMRGETDFTVVLSAEQNHWIYQMIDLINKKLFAEYGHNSGIIARMPFINSIRHMNSVMVNTVTKDKQVTSAEEKSEDEVELPVIPAFYSGVKDKIVYGSNRSNGLFSFTALSLYSAFWQKYNAALETSFHNVEGLSFLSESEINNISFQKTMSFDNQDVMIESIQYEVSNTGLEVVNLKLRTIKNYQ